MLVLDLWWGCVWWWRWYRFPLLYYIIMLIVTSIALWRFQWLIDNLIATLASLELLALLFFRKDLLCLLLSIILSSRIVIAIHCPCFSVFKKFLLLWSYFLVTSLNSILNMKAILYILLITFLFVWFYQPTHEKIGVVDP